MGFTNERRNLTALKSLDGNLDKTIETLVRVGEGRQTPQVKTPAATTSGASVNPFDQLDFKPPAQPAQPNGLSFNPFDIPTQQAQLQPQPAPAQSLEQSFQNLQVTQPLFPHSTGGYPNRQTAQPQYIYGQLAAPFAAPQAGFVSSPQPLEGGNNPFFQTGAQPQASLSTPQPQNPFFNQMSTQAPQMPLQNQSSASAFPQPPRHANTMPPMSTSPFGQPPPFQQPQQQPQHVQQQQLQQPQLGVQTAQPGNSFNPFQSMTAPNTPLAGGYPSQTPFGYPAAAQTLAPQPTGRVDKNSILALYNFSAPPPAIPEQQQTQQQAVPGLGAPPGQLQNPQAAFASSNYTNAGPQPNVNAQSATSRNPFGYPGASGAQQPPAQVPTQANPYGLAMNSANGGANTAFMKSHMSQQSVDINGFQNGRHSPDAFASLSSRFGR
jgi:hypothetical protein